MTQHTWPGTERVKSPINISLLGILFYTNICVHNGWSKQGKNSGITGLSSSRVNLDNRNTITLFNFVVVLISRQWKNNYIIYLYGRSFRLIESISDNRQRMIPFNLVVAPTSPESFTEKRCSWYLPLFQQVFEVNKSVKGAINVPTLWHLLRKTEHTWKCLKSYVFDSSWSISQFILYYT